MLTAALAIVAAVAAAGTFFVDGALLGTPAMNGSARGTALVVLVLALPVLLGCALLARRGSPRAVVGWLGAAAYLAYNAVLFLFATPFNRFFPAYVLMLTLSLAALAVGLARVPDRFPANRWARVVAGYVGLVAALNALAWLRNVLPALADARSPGFLAGTGLTTNPIYVQDLAVWLPLAAVLAVRLWHRRPWGVLGTGALLTFWVIESVSVAADQWFGDRADPASTVVSSSMVLPFLALAAITVIPLALLLSSPVRHGSTTATSPI